MKNLFLLGLILLSVISCKKEDLKTPVLIRVENLTSSKLEDIRVISYTESSPYSLEKNYGDLNPSDVSSYLSHDEVRSNVDYKFKLSGNEQDVSAWCGTGVSYLANGKYTLQIKQDSYGNIFQDIKKD